MNFAETGIAQHTLISFGAENARTTGYVESQIDHAPGTFYGTILGREDLGGPFHPVIYAGGPVFRDPVEVGANGIKFNNHLRNGMLRLGMISHAARKRERAFGFQGHNTFIESAFCQTEVDVAETDESPGKDSEHESVQPRLHRREQRARRTDRE